jgi:AraC family transcriptional regulator, regulatory protein of adaptative response / methylated-DNA-[protein]-cysteine methyltransferase
MSKGNSRKSKVPLSPPANPDQLSKNRVAQRPSPAYNFMYLLNQKQFGEQTMPNLSHLSEDYQRIEQAILYLESHARQQPSLKDLAAHVHLSEYHLQRLFTRWAGISPKRFLQFLTKEHARTLLSQSASLLDASFQSGLSGPSRLHDLFLSTEAVTPGQVKSRGAGLQIIYGFHPTPFGECLLALSPRGVCSLAFLTGSRADALLNLTRRWPLADLEPDQNQTAPWISRIFTPAGSSPIPVHLSGTNFQIQVWEALLRISPGSLISYQQLATHLDKPQAARAVGNAVALNPVTYLIPCHRVIRGLGGFGSYQGGSTRKKALLAWEMAHQSAP